MCKCDDDTICEYHNNILMNSNQRRAVFDFKKHLIKELGIDKL